jgi:tellurite resistance protein TerC
MWAWIGFLLFIAVMMAIDLGLFNRRAHVITMREALTWFGLWIGLALLFNIGLVFFHERGIDAGLEFLTGFLVEKSLSIDNVFVFILIFNYFQVPPVYQHRVLSVGIVGAIVLRLIFILGGLALLERFHWVLYLFGLFLLFTGTMMILGKESEYDPKKSWAIRSFRKLVRITDTFEGNRFWIRKGGKLWATPLLLAILAIESSDIIFAADSIPAIFAITTDPFIVFTSNLFAMLGLRALYFAVQDFMKMFHFLHYGFAMIVMILGVKMLASDFYKLPISISLFSIVFILMACVIASILRPRKADLKQVFERTEQLGLIPFRRLLLIENIVDLGDRHVSGSMRVKSDVKTIRLDAAWSDNLRMINLTRFSRYPVVEREGEKPIGFVHIKSIAFADPMEFMVPEQLREISRRCMEFRENMPLEDALDAFQQNHDRLAIVVNANSDWIGILTFEDVVQEIIGNMGDEFDRARGGAFVSLADTLNASRIILGLQALSMDEAVQKFIAALPRADLPVDHELISRAVLQRKRYMPIYVGNGLAIPHGRLAGIISPVLAFARCDEGFPIEGTNERADLLFLVLTPNGSTRLQARLLANIHALFKSQYVSERLRKAQTAEAVMEAICAGQQVALD